MTAPRRPRSAWLLVGSTPSAPAKVQSAGQCFKRFVAKRRWYFVLVLLRAACSSRVRSSCRVGSIWSRRLARSPLSRNSSQAANTRRVIATPASPNCFCAARPSLWAVKSRTRCDQAELAALGREVVVGRPAVRAGDASEVLAEERLRLALVAVGRDPEDRLGRGERGPERALAAAQAPAGLVDVDGGGGADVIVKLSMGPCERLTGALHERVDGTGRQVGAKQVAHQLDGVAAGDAVPDRERGDRRLKPRPERRAGVASGKLGARLGGTGRAAQPVQAVLRHRDRDRRQLTDLVALRDGRVDTLVLAEQTRAAIAALRPMLNHPIDALERKQPTVPALVARLTATAAARTWRRKPAGRRRRILRRRQRRVTRTAAHLLLELLDTGLKPLVPRRQRENELHTTLPPRVVDRLRLVPLHPAQIRGPTPGPCTGPERLRVFCRLQAFR